MIPFTAIVPAILNTAMHYENPKTAVAQVADLVQVASFDEVRFYVATVMTFRQHSAYQSFYYVTTRPEGVISVVSESTFENAKKSCFMSMDIARAEYDQREMSK